MIAIVMQMIHSYIYLFHQITTAQYTHCVSV